MRRTLVEWVVTLGVAGLFVLVFEVEIAQPFRVPTSSMEPTLQCAEPGQGCTGRLNDRVLVAKIVYRFRDPKRYEIAVFHAPALAKSKCSEGGTFLKRVIGLPDETVAIREGRVYINGRPLLERYIPPGYLDHEDYPPTAVPPEHFFVLGDHRISSNDSRVWGTVDRKYIYGKAVFVYWPFNQLGSLE